MPSSSTSTSTRRLAKELEQWRKSPASSAAAEDGIERLGPVGDGDDLYRWEAVIDGKGIGGGYDDGRWLLSIHIPPTYPLLPPTILFLTSVIHPNISLTTGEICLDLLNTSSEKGDAAWTPAYTLVECVKAVRRLLKYPEVDSPLNVDVAALLRNGDVVGARGLVEMWIGSTEGRYQGP